MDQLAHGRCYREYLFICGRSQGGIVGTEPRFLHGLALHCADPAVQHQGQRAALGAGFGGKVTDQLPVGGQPLTLGALQTPFGRQIGIRHDKTAVHHIVADGLQKKAFAAAIAPDDEAERCAAL